jgi:hemerythrin-like domain-containing protein
MISYDALNSQIHTITELSNVLAYLVEDRAMCDTRTCCELFQRYIDSIKAHIDMVERSIYPLILTSGDQQAINRVSNFMNGSQEVKRILKQFTRNWCPTKNETLKIRDHAAFIKDSDELFEVILQRLQDETEKLYLLSRNLE